MKSKNILNIINSINELDLSKSNSKINMIFYFIKETFEKNEIILQKFDKSVIRFGDYYDREMHRENVLDFFNNCYDKEDINEQTLLFLLYLILNNTIQLIESFEVCSDAEEIEELMSDEIENLTYFIGEYTKLNEITTEKMLGFENNKYKIFFSGFSYDDVNDCEKYIIKALINKLNLILSVEDNIKGAEVIGHVRDKFGVNILRIHLANDYRVAFIRNGEYTIILGIELKSGKDSDYTRYDTIARKIDEIYKEFELFKKDLLPESSIHFKTIDYLKKIKNKTEDNISLS